MDGDSHKRENGRGKERRTEDLRDIWEKRKVLFVQLNRGKKRERKRETGGFPRTMVAECGGKKEEIGHQNKGWQRDQFQLELQHQ